jgi:hypothetical protein
LRNAQDKLKDRDAWAKSVATYDSDDEATLRDHSVDPSNVYETTKGDLESQIDKLRHKASSEISLANASRRVLIDRRERGAYKLSANIESFLANLSLFIRGYSGIVEIVKAADNQFGGLAWGTLSIFLSVAARKQEKEDEITCTIAEFARHCPRLQIFRDVYADEDLKRHIMEMYDSIIEFARSATEYYQRRSIGRIISSSNPKLRVTQTIEDVQSGLVNIRRDCEALMQQRIHELSRLVEEMKVEQVRTNESLEQTQRNRNAKYMARLKSQLDLPNGLASNLSLYESLLSKEIFEQPSRGSTFPTRTTRKKLEKEPAFTQWMSDLDPGLLFLSGKNAAWINQTTLNWLSQAAVQTAERLKEEKQEVGHIFCQTKSLLGPSEKHSIKSIFAHLAFQLLESRPTDPRDISSEFEAIVQSDEWKSEDEHDALRAGTMLLQKVLGTYRSDETVFLIIDRIDQCRWSYETERLRQGVCNALDALLSLVLTAPCKLKILVVSSATSHDHDLRLSVARRHEPRSMDRYLERCDWDQD